MKYFRIKSSGRIIFDKKKTFYKLRHKDYYVIKTNMFLYKNIILI